MPSRATRKETTVERRPRKRVSGQSVHFELASPAADSVCIAGTFNNWSLDADRMIRAPDGTWIKELSLAPGIYEYRLIVDGQWIPDPNACHSILNSFGERNSLLTVS